MVRAVLLICKLVDSPLSPSAAQTLSERQKIHRIAFESVRTVGVVKGV